MIKRFLAMALSAIMAISLLSGITFTASAADYTNQSHMLKVKGNKLVWEDDESVEVVLSGVNLPGGEWTGTPGAEQLERNIQEAMNNWHCNVIRLAVGTKGWGNLEAYLADPNGYRSKYNYYDYGNPKDYREYMDRVISYAEKAGKYVILDLHEYGLFDEKDLQFWKEAAEAYKNNPTVLFGILNEPTKGSWDIWRNGGMVLDNDGVERYYYGHQYVVEMIRDTGARNIIVAGGRSYAKNTSGVVSGYALVDQNSKGETNVGNGIMYDTHWYAWHGYTSSWNKDIGPTRMQYPMLMGEFGWDAGLNLELGKKTFKPGDEQYHDKWFTHLENFFDDYETYDNYMNFTAYSFHPSSAPAMLLKTDENGVGWSDSSYAFTPTDYHGVYIRDMLIRRFGTSLAKGKTVIDQSSGRASDAADASFAIDGDKTTTWKCSRSGNRYFTVDLGGVYKIKRYAVRHGSTGDYKDATAFQLYVSKDNVNWTLLDSVADNQCKVTDRYVVPTSARYIKYNISAVAGGQAIGSAYDFHVVGTASDGLDTVEYAAPSGFDVTEHIVAKNQKIDFAAGQKGDDWTKAGYIIYSEKAAENGVGSALELSGMFGDTQTFGCSGAGSFGNFKNFDGFRFKYSSNIDTDFQVSLHYRASNREKFTNVITLPNTNGKWTTVVITPDQLMPTASDTWVKTDMVSQYNTSLKNYEPVVKLHFTGEHDFDQYARFEYFEAVWYGTADYRPDYLSFKGGMNDGFVEVAIRWQNDSGVIDGLFNFMCLYDKKGNLINMVCDEISLPANTRSPKYFLSMFMPENVSDFSNYFIKVYTWRSGNGGYPVCEAVTLNSKGEVTYSR